jgi:membrane fusion protein (multidrug efflux system)
MTAATNETSPGRTAGLKKAGAIAIVAVVLAGFAYWLHARHYESTDDAFIEGHVTALSPNVAGTVTAVHVEDNQEVKAGEPLVEIDQRPFEVKLAQDRADAIAAQADAKRAASDYERDKTLFKQDAISKQTLDHAEAAAAEADARLVLEQKKVAADELDLSYTRIAAPMDGRVARKSVEAGSYVQVGQQLMAVVPHQVWVVANFKETQLTLMRPGQEASIKVDAYPGREFSGKVESIQSGTGARFSLLPPENATGNYVKVVQRVPVKIVFDPGPDASVLLAPGMSVEPKVKVR